MPDLPRGGIAPFAPPLARMVGNAALSLAWRLTQPGNREPYLVKLPSTGLDRRYYTADDGWRAPVFLVPAHPGTSGEPVLLVHGLGGTHRDWAIEPVRCLAGALARAGFAVYLLEHRADRSALPPASAGPFSADDIAVRDVEAALDLVREHSGYPRVLVAGHGFGGALLYLRLALLGVDGLAALLTVGTPVTFDTPSTATRAAGMLATLLPPNWTLPGRRAAQAVSPFVACGADLGSPGTEGPVARAWLRHASGDLHVGVLQQLARWVEAGRLMDATGRYDVLAALPRLPSLVVAPDADPACPPGAAVPAAEPLGATLLTLTGGWGHLDPLLGARASGELHPELVRFFEASRRRCW